MDPNEQKLIEYIKTQLARNVDRDAIITELSQVGWANDKINDAFDKVKNNFSSSAEPALEQTENEHDQTPIYSQDAHVVVNNDPGLRSDEKRFSHPKTILVALILIFFVLAAGSVYGYFYYHLAPDRVLAQSFEKMQSVQSYNYSGSLLLKISGDLFSDDENIPEFLAFSLFIPREFGIRFSGSMDNYDQDEIKTSTEFSLDVNSVNIAEIQNISIREISYLKINRFNLIPMQNVLNKWLLLDMNEISQTYGLDYDADQKAELAKEDSELIMRSLAANNPLEILEDLGADTINDKKVFHYKYKINKDKLKLFITDMTEVLNQMPEYEQMDIDGVSSMLEEIEFFDGEMWIGRDDYLLYGINGGMSFDMPESSVKTEIIFDLSLNEYNTPKNINSPSDFMTLEEFGEMLMLDMQSIIPYDDFMKMDDNGQPDDIGSFLRAFDLTQSSELGVSDGF